MAETKDLIVPALGESLTEAVIGVWLKDIGQAVAMDEPLVDLETDKITVQLTAPAAGVLTEVRAAVGDTVEVGAVIGVVTVGQVADVEPATGQAVSPPTSATPASELAIDDTIQIEPIGPAASAPAGAGAAAIDDELLRRSTPAQRRALRLGHEVPAAAPTAPAATPAPAVAAPTRADEDVVPMSRLRKRIAERLVQAQTESASLTTFNEVDMSAVMAMRSAHKQAFLDTHGVKLGFMSFFAKACAAACKLYPGLNAEIRDDAIVYKKHYDFGVAVSTERGLVVPVVRGVDRLSFAEVENSIIELATRARTSRLTLDDLTGGTFTLTNGGVFGSMLSTPLLNYPQTGILGMHNIVKRPVAVGDRVEVRPVMYLALTYDHRVVDGRQAVQFLVAVKDRIEHPERLLLDL